MKWAQDLKTITPEVLHAMSDDELLTLNDELHAKFGCPSTDVNKEDVLNVYLLLKDECKSRGVDLPKTDGELERAAAKLRRESIDPGKMVPFVVTSQAVSLSGSAAYGLDDPQDLDWVIRASERIPLLEESLSKVFPDKTNHFIYELKGPNWKNYPVADFVASREMLAESAPISFLGRRFPGCVDLGPFIFVNEDSSGIRLRVNTNARDSGTTLKLERLFQDPFLEVYFSTTPMPGEQVLANLFLSARDKFELQLINEPQFEPFYRMKPRAFREQLEEAKAEKITGDVTLRFGEWFPPIKVAAGYAPEESMDPEMHWKYFVEPMIRRDGYVLLQQKFDGERMTLHVDKGKKLVKIFTEGAVEKKRKGLERSAIMPDVVGEALEKLRCKSCILDAEVTVHDKEGHPLPRHEITELAVGKKPVKDVDIRFNCFDIGYLDGELTPNDDYERRLELLRKVVPAESKHFKVAETHKVRNRKEFDKIWTDLSALIGSEGIMSKTKKMPFFEPSAKTGETSKLKVLFEIDVAIIGRRKVAAAKPTGEKVTAAEMEKALPELKKKSNTWTFRCAFKGPDGKLWPMFSDKRYAPGDLKMRWDEERAVWRGTEDPSEWEMMEGFPNSAEGMICYGNTYNFSPAEGEPEPKLGTIITVAPIIMRAWESHNSVLVSWTFPKCRRLYPQSDEPMDWKIVNNILKATAKRHGKEAKTLIEDDMKRVPFEQIEKMREENDMETCFALDDFLAEVKQPFGSPGGKKNLVKRLLPLIPKHKTYVEPFGGAAALLFAKEPSEVEIYSDIQPEYPFILRTLRNITDDEIQRLRRKDWTGSKERHRKFRMEGWRAGGDKIDKLYRILYLIKYGWGSYWTDKFGYANKRVSSSFFDTLPAVRERLKNVRILNRDAYKLIPEVDGEDTFFYLDPPYDIDFIVKAKAVFGGHSTDLRKLRKLCKGIRGKFLLSMNDNPDVRRAFRGFHQRVLFTRKTSAGYSTVKKEYMIPATRRRELLISNYPLDKLEEAKKEPTHEEQREYAEKLYGDPYMIDAKGKTSEFVVQHHLRGIWTEKERKQLLEQLKAAQTQDELEALWKEYTCEYLVEPVDNWRKRIQEVDDQRGDVEAVLNKYLSAECPKIGEIDYSKIVQRGNMHTDLRMKVPDKKYLIGWTITDPRIVIQYLESGKLETPLRDKFLENQPNDKSPCTRKAAQPETWFHLVDERAPAFEAAPGEVGATAESGGRFIFKTRGEVAWGIQKDDYHEMYFWFKKPYESLSGRWGFQRLTGRPEYEKVPAVWWMLDKPHKTQAPYIIQHSRESVEQKAAQEGLEHMNYNPELLVILQKDKAGRKWLSIGLNKEITPEFIEAKVEEYRANGAKWGRK